MAKFVKKELVSHISCVEIFLKDEFCNYLFFLFKVEAF